jgi:nucleotide-binding universal stress UspA family protein
MKTNESAIRLRRILVPVDFSAGTLEALQYAATVAGKFSAIVTVLHVVQLSIAGEERWIPRMRLLNELRATSEQQLRKVVERFIEPPQFGFLGEPRVNVLLLNLALDRRK